MKILQGLHRRAKYNIAALFIAGLLFPVLSCNFSFAGEEPGPGKEPVPGEEEGTDKWRTERPLHDIYKTQFLVGNIVSPGDLNNTTRFDLLKRHFNTATAENHMKPDNIAPLSKPVSDTWAYRFTQADSLINAVNAAGMTMHGHVLVWHSQTPSWLTTGDKATVLANLEKYVTEVAAHFKGKLISWDVVNEVMRDGLTAANAAGDWKSCLRMTDNPWNKAIGPEYIEKAFLAARAADPDAKLFYNDYNLNDADKARAVYNMVADINNRHPNVEGRKLIDGIGMQSHHHIYTDPQTVEASIVLFASLGVDITISEMDIQAAETSAWGKPALSWGENAARLQAQQYAAMFRIFKKHESKISRVTFWGLDDGTSWRASTHPTLLKNDYGLKPAFYAVADPSLY
jgi:endo-1,4-beta-xylanase